MLPLGVEQEAGPGLDRDLEPELVGPVPGVGHEQRMPGVGVEHADVRRDRDALVPEVGEQPHRVEQPVVREPVRVVGQSEHGLCL